MNHQQHCIVLDQPSMDQSMVKQEAIISMCQMEHVGHFLQDI